MGSDRGGAVDEPGVMNRCDRGLNILGTCFCARPFTVCGNLTTAPPTPMAASLPLPPPFVAATLASAKPRLFTLAIVHDQPNQRVLLGRKKKGFGQGYYNGFGGKVEPGETIAQAAHRELLEEAGVTVPALHPRGVLTFVFDDQPVPWEVHVFGATAVIGQPQETDEMAPLWVSTQQLPYDAMWQDDRFWYPLFLRGASFEGLFAFTQTHTMLWHHLRELRDVADAAGAAACLLPHPQSGGQSD